MNMGSLFLRRSLCHRAGVVLFATLLIGLGRTSVAAESTAPYVVEIAGPFCRFAEFPSVAFLDSLRVELAGRGFTCCSLIDPAVPSASVGTLRVNLEIMPCAADATAVHIGVSGPSEVPAVESQVSWADVAPTARARALALAAAELIRSFGHVPAEESPTVAVSQPPPPAPAPSRVIFNVEGQTRLVPTRKTVLWGGRLRMTRLWAISYAQIDVGADTGSAGAELGRVSLHSASVGLGAGARWTPRTAAIHLGPRLELGWAWIRGEAGTPNVTSGSGAVLFSTLGMRASLEIPASLRFRPGIALEGGGVIHGARGEADGRTVIGITGYYLIGSMALAVSL